MSAETLDGWDEETLPDSQIDATGIDNILEQLQFLDTDLAALELRKKALLDNMDLLINRRKEERRRVLFACHDQLESFVKAHLEGSEKKSIRFPHGMVGFRSSPGSVKIRERAEVRALLWCKEHCTSAIKVSESILVSLMDKKTREILPNQLFEVTPPHERFYVDTGIKEAKP
jgi:hypothetical protein